MSKKKIAENRWWNFRQLVRAAGGNNAAARRIGLGDSVVQAYAGENARMNIGDKIAQKIATGFGLKPGTLDLGRHVVSPGVSTDPIQLEQRITSDSKIQRPTAGRFFSPCFVVFCLLSAQQTYILHIRDALRIPRMERRPS